MATYEVAVTRPPPVGTPPQDGTLVGMELEDELEELRDEIATWQRRNPGAHHRDELKGRVVKATTYRGTATSCPKPGCTHEKT